MKPPTDHRHFAQYSSNWALLRDIEIISCVVVERKTTGAAERLGLSQSAVSRAIAKIEHRLGRKLFHREGGRLTPTADALRLHERGNAIFEALAGLDNAETKTSEQVSVVAPPTLSHLYLTREIATFARQHPRIMISLDIVTIEELPGWIAEGRSDLGLCDTTFLHAGVMIEQFIETPAICFMREDHPLARKTTIAPEDLHGRDYVAIHKRHSLRGTLDKIFADATTRPRITIETGGAVMAAELIREGLGVSVLNPFPLVLQDMSGLTCRRFDANMPFRTNFLMPGSTTPSVATRLFLDFMKARREDLRHTLAQKLG